ncbi:chloride channel protein, partial [Parvimonas micra]
MKSLENVSNNHRKEDLKLLFYGILVGIVAGGLSSFYRYIIHGIEGIIGGIVNISRNHFYIYPIIFIALIFISFLVTKIKKMSRFCGGSGIPQVEAEIKGYINPNPVKVLLAKIFGGALTALAGFSVGREGPSIQIGAMSGKLVSRKLKKNKTVEKFLITCGASAGLAAAFNAPVAGILFAVEEVHRHISKKLLVVCMAATITADLVSKILYGTETVFNFSMAEKLPLVNYWTLILFAVVLSVLGVLYIFLMEFFMKIQDGLKLKKEFKLIPYFLLPIVILIFTPNLLGGGGFLMKELQTVDFPIYMLILLFIV